MATDRYAVRRTTAVAGLTLAGVTGEGRFSGYASVFGEIDLGKDTIERGAFLHSLAKRGAGGVRMLFQHDPNEPIGTWTTTRALQNIVEPPASAHRARKRAGECRTEPAGASLQIGKHRVQRLPLSA